MAAEQAAQVADVPTVVVPTTTIPQGITAMMAFNPELALEDNQAQMAESREYVQSGQITYSIRDTEIDGVTIKKDDYLGLVNGKIVLSLPELEEALYATLTNMVDEDSELVTILVGEEGTVELAEQVSARLTEQFEDVEIEIVQGDQPVYHYILAAE